MEQCFMGYIFNSPVVVMVVLENFSLATFTRIVRFYGEVGWGISNGKQGILPQNILHLRIILIRFLGVLINDVRFK